MMLIPSRLSLALRGPATPLLAIGLALLLTVVGRSAFASTGRTTATAVPSATTPAGPAFFLDVLGSPGFKDHHTGLALRVGDQLLFRAGSPAVRHEAATMDIFIQIRLHNTGKHSARYDRGNFYAVDSTGRVYQSLAVKGRVYELPGLNRGTIPPGATRSGWLAFAIAIRATKLDISWNDDNHLLPPSVVTRVGVIRAGGS